MRKWLGKIEWEDIMSKCSLEEMWSKFCEKIQQATEKFVPVIKGKSRHYPKWMNKDAKLARKTKFKMWKRFQHTKSYNDLIGYKIARVRVIKIYWNARKSFETK
jgi:hypothetical protein